jgi:hypothetical protein
MLGSKSYLLRCRLPKADMRETRRHSVLWAELASYTAVFLGLGILAMGLHDSLQGMTARDCDRGVVAACDSIGR